MIIINNKKTKQFILQTIQERRPNSNLSRVSKDALTELNDRLKRIIIREVESHPSIGKTFKIF